MPPVSSPYAAPIGVAVNIPTTTETVVATVQVATALAGQRVVLSGRVSLTPGTTTSSATVRIRRGSDATGTLVKASPAFTCVAAAPIALVVDGVDSPGEYGGPYVLTVQQAAATAAGTADGELTAQPL